MRLRNSMFHHVEFYFELACFIAETWWTTSCYTFVMKTLAILTAIARFIVASHFVFELVDKILRYEYWKNIIFKQANVGEWSLVLIMILLFVGSATLVLGQYIWIGLFCLSLFQIPTSILFEDSLYESFDSVSALGGVFAVCLLHFKPRTKPTEQNDLLQNLTWTHRMSLVASFFHFQIKCWKKPFVKIC